MTESKSASNKAEVTTTVPIDAETDVKGTVRIAPTVLIQLIETTVGDIDGVVAITSRRGKNREEEFSGRAFDDGKVRVVVDGDQIDVDVAVTLLAGTDVGSVTEEIRREVGVAAGRMLGMTVRSVDIYVDNFAAGEA
jgi:uncharacterized alkaline shock family protein YloU